MVGNDKVRTRHNRVATRDDVRVVARGRWLECALLFAATLTLARDAAGRNSCPLATSVSPFAKTVSGRYEVVLTDGAEGDLDGAANGGCQVALELCRGESPLCEGETIDGARVRAVGGTSPAARETAEEDVTHAIESLAGTAGSTCSVVRLSLAAEEDASLGFRFRVATHGADGRGAVRRSRLMLRCLPPVSGRTPNAQCFSGKRDCPAAVKATCGDGIVNRAREECDGADAAACPGACTASCTCSSTGPGTPQPPGVPTCGDGARNQLTERCDGTDDAACPGACNPDCTCGTTSGALDIAPLAVATASSSEPGSSPSAAVDGVVDGMPGQAKHEWVSNGEGHGAWLRLTWNSPVTIDRVILHDRPNNVDNVTDGALLVGDDAAPVSTGPLPPDGAPAAVMIGPRTITALTFMVMQATGTSAGLSEIEAVAAKKVPTTTTTTTTSATTLPPTSTTTTTRPTTTAPPTTTTSTTTPPSVSTTTLDPPPTLGAIYYLAPSGNDANAGTSAGQAWKTFAKAVKTLQAGDTLVVGDGKYTRTTTGLPVIDCTKSAHNGTAVKPITIRAAHERKAWLASDGIGDSLYMNKCSYWNVVGLYASSADNTGAQPWEGNVFHLMAVDHVNLQRLLVVRPNRTCPNNTLTYCNSHGISIENSHDMLVEESEVYDFHRHGVSAFASRRITVRRCYMNPWDAIGGAGGGSTGVILYGSSDSIVENVIGEGVYGLNIAGGTTYDGTPGGYHNQLLGVITLNPKYGATIRARKFSGPVLPAGHNLLKDDVFVGAANVGIYSRGSADTQVENVSVFNSAVDAGVAADEDLGEGAPCSANPEGCSISARNLLSVANAGQGMRVNTSVTKTWSLEYSNLFGNKGGNFPTGETPGDDAGNIRRSESVAPTGMGVGQCLLWVPDGSNMKSAGMDGKDIGASVLRRYRDGVLTTERLWDRTTGAFPCGATVAGVNDTPARTCIGVHTRLNVNTNGCAFPASY
jgi:hypothetical protein